MAVGDDPGRAVQSPACGELASGVRLLWQPANDMRHTHLGVG